MSTLGDAVVNLIIDDMKFNQRLQQQAARVAQEASLIADKFNIAYGKNQVAKVDAMTSAMKRQQQVASAMARASSLDIMTGARARAGQVGLGNRSALNRERLEFLRQQNRERLAFQREAMAMQASGGGGGGIGFGTVVAGTMVGQGLSSALSQSIGMVQQGIQYNATIQQSTASLEVLLGSLSKATTFMNEIREFAAKTPFEMPELNKAAVSLLATKKIAESDVMPVLKKLGDAAAGSSEGFAAFPRVTRAVSQMLTKGKIQAEEMMQLAEAGVPAWQALATQMGKSTEEVQAMGQRGELGRAQIMMLVDGLGNAYKGMADKQSKTYLGLASTIRDNLGKAIGDATKPLFDLAMGGMQKLVAAMDSPQFQGFIESLASGFQTAIKYGEELVNSPLAQAVAKFAAIALGVGAVVGGVVVLEGAIASAFAIAPLVAFTAAATTLVSYIHEAFTGPDAARFIELFETGKGLVLEIAANIKNLLAPLIGQLTGQVSDMFGQSKFNEFLATVMGGINEFLDLLSIVTTDWKSMTDIMGTAWDLLMVRMADQIEYLFRTKIPQLVDQFGDMISIDRLMMSKEDRKRVDDMMEKTIGVNKPGQPTEWITKQEAFRRGLLEQNPSAAPESPESQAMREQLSGLLQTAELKRNEVYMARLAERLNREHEQFMKDDAKKREREANDLSDPFSEASNRAAMENRKKKLLSTFGSFFEGLGMFAGPPSAPEQDNRKLQTQMVGLTDFNKRIQESLGASSKEKREAEKLALDKKRTADMQVVRDATKNTAAGVKQMVGTFRSAFGFGP